MDEYVKSNGFNSLEEFNKLVSAVDLTTPEKIENFKSWQHTDGTKEGLLKL